MIIACILAIGCGGVLNDAPVEEVVLDIPTPGVGVVDVEDPDKIFNVVVTLILALVTGGAFTYNTVTIQQCINSGFDLN